VPNVPGDGRVEAVATTDAEHRSEVLGIARQGGLNFVGAVFNQVLRFVITLLLGRLLGAAGAGLYYQAFAFLAFLGVVSSAGFTMTLTRYVAVHRADGDDGALRGTVRLGLVTPTVAASAIGLGLYLASSWLADVAFEEPRLGILLRFVAVALPATVYTDAALSATQGFKTMTPYALINLFFEPVCRVSLTLLLLAAGWGLDGVMVALVATNWVSATLASIALRRLMGRSDASPRYNVREIFSFSGLSWFSHLASNGLLWADTILLGLFRSAAEVGVYQVATRLTLLGTVFLAPVTGSFAPRIADLWRRERYELLDKTYRLITSWIFRLALPSFVALLVFPRELLSLFGSGFEAGVSVTIIMTLAWLVNAAGGPCGYMLTMSGRPAIQTINNIGALALNLGLNLWLVPQHGIVGAATAWAASLVAVTTARVVQVWAFTRILPLSTDLLKGVGAALAAGAAAVAVRTLLDGWPSLVAGLMAIAVIYVAATARLGIDADDRLVLGALRRRLGRGSRRPPAEAST
jgi:O-antigen/teichoic acid export membrane protein